MDHRPTQFRKVALRRRRPGAVQKPYVAPGNADDNQHDGASVRLLAMDQKKVHEAASSVEDSALHWEDDASSLELFSKLSTETLKEIWMTNPFLEQDAVQALFDSMSDEEVDQYLMSHPIPPATNDEGQDVLVADASDVPDSEWDRIPINDPRPDDEDMLSTFSGKSNEGNSWLDDMLEYYSLASLASEDDEGDV